MFRAVRYRYAGGSARLGARPQRSQTLRKALLHHVLGLGRVSGDQGQSTEQAHVLGVNELLEVGCAPATSWAEVWLDTRCRDGSIFIHGRLGMAD
jgi:hypothetical protein